MKLLLLLIPVLGFSATKPVIDRIESMQIKKEGYLVNFENHNLPVFVNYFSDVIPCLENANKADMEILLTFNSKGDSLAKCQLYTNPKSLNVRRVRDTDGIPGVWIY